MRYAFRRRPHRSVFAPASFGVGVRMKCDCYTNDGTHAIDCNLTIARQIEAKQRVTPDVTPPTVDVEAQVSLLSEQQTVANRLNRLEAQVNALVALVAGLIDVNNLEIPPNDHCHH